MSALCGLGSAPIATATSLTRLSAYGNHIVRDGAPYNFYGVNRDTLEWGRYNWGGCGGDGHFTAQDFDEIRGWGATAVRFPLSQADWLGRRCPAPAYAAMIDRAVSAANARGMYAILDLHWSDVRGLAPCDFGCLTGQQPMPDSDSVRFWRGVASRYANRPGVIFDLYNEPHSVSWGCWRDGGCLVWSSTANSGTGLPVLYRAVGLQQLYNVVRGTGARNLVLAAGLDWGFDLSGVGHGYALRGYNVAYDTHVYFPWHRAKSDWDAHFGYLTSAYPVTSTEFGSLDCSTGYTAPLLQYLYAPGSAGDGRISWTAWSWSDPGSCAQPSVIADWQGTPLWGQGQLVHDVMAELSG
jgi:aryl-phospho-beta-D-glucosidase BglC (GH1 family)